MRDHFWCLFKKHQKVKPTIKLNNQLLAWAWGVVGLLAWGVVGLHSNENPMLIDERLYHYYIDNISITI